MFRLVFNIYKNYSLLRAHLFYRKFERGGDCKECSYCCGENWEQSSKVESACKEQGLGRCICKPSFRCRKKCPNPTRPIVTTGTPITPTKKKLMTSPQNEQKTRANSTSTVRNSSKTPEFHNSNAYDSTAEHSQKGEINITLI